MVKAKCVTVHRSAVTSVKEGLVDVARVLNSQVVQSAHIEPSHIRAHILRL